MRIIAGTERGRRIEAPEGRITRPTLDRVRENLFNMLQGQVTGARVLDLFSGSGALSLEALSRGAAFAVLADRDRRATQCQRRNVESLRYADRTRILSGDWRDIVRTLTAEGETFDLVFLDPPYEMTDLRPVLDALRGVITGRTLVVLEHEARRETLVPDDFVLQKERGWGFCAVRFYRLREEETP